MNGFEELMAALKESNRPYDFDMITQAYEYADKAHERQMRQSGEPYITHPIAVARILVELGMDTETICAGLLHDVVEDTASTLDEIKKMFGADVALMVDGVTKLTKLSYSSKEQRQAENVRKMLLAMAKDVRVIIVKLADRLHNMRTGEYWKEYKRREKALETMEVYAPLADRLGIRSIKEELEDISLRFLDPIAYEEIERMLKLKKEERERFLDAIQEKIRERLNKEGMKFFLQSRVKSIYGIYRKVYMQGRNFDEIYDVYAVRVIVDTSYECYSVLGIMHDEFTPIPKRFKDYISTPKANMYQSLHTTVLDKEGGIPFEIQIRTWEMHYTAEYGIAAHWKYKAGIEKKDKLEERLAVRPTSETMFCDHWSRVLHSYRELPMKYNQWCSVVRWEKTTRPFLRSREFWWQEGHTIHETAAEAEAETQQQLNCYADTCEQDLAIPVVKGRKTDKEKFAGAEATYTIEAMMKDGKALQSGTSHYFGDKFSKAYNVTFTGRDNQLHHPFQTSWGVSTRLVGAIIMTHGDDDGLILPPAIAPIQVVVVPIAAHKPGVSEKAAELAEKISKYARVKLDDSDNAPGWKFAQWEMKGVPLRLEIGPKDLEKNQCVLVRRDTREKVFVSLDELETAIPAQLEALRKDLYQRALENREKRTWAATTMDEVKELAKANTGYIKTMWCGDLACEMKMKEEAGLSSRCMPFEQEQLSDVCPCCGKPAKAMVYWGVAY